MDKPHREERNMDMEAHRPRTEEAAHVPVQEQAPRSAPAPRQAGSPASRVAEGVQDTARTPDTADTRDKATNTGIHTADQAEHAGNPGQEVQASLRILVVPSEAAFRKTTPSRHSVHSREPASAFGDRRGRESALVNPLSNLIRFAEGAAKTGVGRQGCSLGGRFP